MINRGYRQTVQFKSHKAKIGYGVKTHEIYEEFYLGKCILRKSLGVLDTTWGLTEKGSLRRANRRYARKTTPKDVKTTLALVVPVCAAIITVCGTIIAALIKLG